MNDSFTFDNNYADEFELSSESAFSKITSYSISYNVATLIDLIHHQELELEPEFQRNFVWDKRMASLFIDSLLIGFPTPNLFFGRNSAREDFIVIDGLQRLKTLYFFITEKFSGSNSFKLVGLHGRSWDNCSFTELSLNHQRRLKNSIQNATIIDDIDFNPDIVHELFFRINTGGIPLTNQEVRNCVFIGEFNRTLHEVNSYPAWRELLGTPEPHTRLADIELVLRIMSLITEHEQYRPPMHTFLSHFQAKHRDSSMYDLAQLFRETTDVITQAVGDNTFTNKGVVKRTLLEPVFVALGICASQNYSVDNIALGIENISTSIEETKHIGSATTSRSAVQARIQLALDIFRK